MCAWFLSLSNIQGTWEELHVMSGASVHVHVCLECVCICMCEVHLYYVFMG